MINRKIEPQILDDLTYFPIAGIIGPRQVGKTTLAKMLLKKLPKSHLYLDLELDSDLQKLEDAETYLRLHLDKCIVIDEVQRLPRLLPLLRAMVDIKREPARFIILGSASPRLIRETSETLAGRIAYSELSPFSLLEVKDRFKMREHWLKGGFPDALLSPKAALTWRWLDNFAKTFIERDLRELGHEVSPPILRRMLSMLGHIHGQLLNIADLSRALSISQPTVRRYLDLLEGGFIIHRLQPYFKNISKRLVKSPKVYFRDSGLFHQLVNIKDLDALYGHIMIGASWEGYVIEQIKRVAGDEWQFYFYRTHGGTEVDLVLINPKGSLFCIEIKNSNAPTVSKGFYQAIEDLKPDAAYIIIPDGESYPKKKQITVINLVHFLEQVL